MKIGVKTYNSETFLNEFEDSADFFEIQAIQKNNYDFLKKYKKPIVIHAEHYSFGVNFADRSLCEKNLKSINFARSLADKTNAKKIIVHPGNLINNNCSKNFSINFIKSLNDERIIIENLTEINQGLCKNPEETEEFARLTGKKICFDISHCIASANLSGIDYEKMILEYIKLKPFHYHLGGQDTNSNIDNHYSFFDKKCNLQVEKILKLLTKDSEITLEVTSDIDKTKKDLDYIKKIIRELKNE